MRIYTGEGPKLNIGPIVRKYRVGGNSEQLCRGGKSVQIKGMCANKGKSEQI